MHFPHDDIAQPAKLFLCWSHTSAAPTCTLKMGHNKVERVLQTLNMLMVCRPDAVDLMLWVSYFPVHHKALFVLLLLSKREQQQCWSVRTPSHSLYADDFRVAQARQAAEWSRKKRCPYHVTFPVACVIVLWWNIQIGMKGYCPRIYIMWLFAPFSFTLSFRGWVEGCNPTCWSPRG